MSYEQNQMNKLSGSPISIKIDDGEGNSTNRMSLSYELLQLLTEELRKRHKRTPISARELQSRLDAVSLPFDEVESGCDGVIMLQFVTDDPEYNEYS